MSDAVAETSAHPGGVSSRNVDTTTYRVMKPLPVAGIAEVGGTFRSWPWGEAIAWIMGPGPLCTNGDLRDWEGEGVIERVADAPGVREERPQAASGGLTAIPAAGNAASASAATRAARSRPWTLPGAEGGKG